MTQGLGYYASGDCIAQIATEYGEKLQDLLITEKLHLLGVCAVFLGAISDDSEPYDLAAANADYPLVSTGDIDRILELLQAEISETSLKGFLLALANQIFETPVLYDDDTFDDCFTSLMEDGMNESVARKAAQVAATDHVALPRTAAAQAAVDAALAQFKGIYMQRDRMAELLEPV